MKSLKPLLIALGVILILAIPTLGTYNSLVTSQLNVERAASDLDTQYQRRVDLIPNVVETVQAEMAHEKEIFTEIANARAKVGSAATIAEKDAADTQLGSALSRLLVMTENYPTLKANEAMRDLRVQIEGTENRVLVARKDYNAVAQKHNLKVRKFPGSIFAGMFGFEEADMFKAQEGADKAPKVSFDKGDE